MSSPLWFQLTALVHERPLRNTWAKTEAPAWSTVFIHEPNVCHNQKGLYNDQSGKLIHFYQILKNILGIIQFIFEKNITNMLIYFQMIKVRQHNNKNKVILKTASAMFARGQKVKVTICCSIEKIDKESKYKF